MTIAIVIVTILLTVALVALLMDLGLRELIGCVILEKLFPVTYPHKGDRIDVYINGKWNRTATVTACCYSYIVLFNAVRCPVDYRGNFYAVGEDVNGNTLVYVDKKHRHLVKSAEFIRKLFNTPDEFATFLDVDEGKDAKEIFSGIKAAANGDEVPEITEEGMP